MPASGLPRARNEVVARVWEDLEGHGLDVISPFRFGHPGDYAMPRPHEVAAALNRLPGLRVNQKRADRAPASP